MVKFIDYLQEEYVTTAYATVYGRGDRTIFENPSRKELQECCGGEEEDCCRFIINFTTKKLYVFSGDLIHQEAATVLREMKLIPTSGIYMTNFTNTCFAGIGTIVAGKIVYSSTYEGTNITKFLHSKWLKTGDDEWLSVWFTKPFIETAFSAEEKIWKPEKPRKKKKGEFAERAAFKKKSNIKEEYEITLRSGQLPYTVYKNPTRDDFKELAKEIRLGGDRDLTVRALVDLQHQNIYVWDANRAIHFTVMHELVRKTNISNNPIQFTSVLINNKIDIKRVDFPWTVDEPWLKEYIG